MLLNFCDVKCLLLGIVLCGVYFEDVASDKSSPPPNLIRGSYLQYNLSQTTTSETALISFSFNKDPDFVRNIKVKCTNPNTGESREEDLEVAKKCEILLTELEPNTNYSCIATFTTNKNVTEDPFQMITRLYVNKTARIPPLIRNAETGPKILNKTVEIHSASIDWYFRNSSNGTDGNEDTINMSIFCISNRNTSNQFRYSTRGSTLETQLTQLLPYTTYYCNCSTNISYWDLVTFNFTTQKVENGPKILNKSVEIHSASIDWYFGNSTNGTDGNDDTINMSIFCINNRNNRNTSNQFIYSTRVSTFETQLTDLLPNTTYSCNCSTNISSWDIVTFHFTTEKDTISLKMNVTAEANTILIEWNQESNYEHLVEIEILRPNHFVPSVCTSDTSKPVVARNVTDSFYKYIDAQPNYYYRINLTLLVNETAKITRSEEVSTKTAAPGKIRNLDIDLNSQIKHQETFSYNLTWEMPCFPNGNITEYKININGTYNESSSSLHQESKRHTPGSLETTKLTCRLDSLKPSYNYRFEVAAVSGNLTGSFTYINFTIPSHLPAPPNVTTISSSTEIHVSWDETKYMGEIIGWIVHIMSLGPMYQQPDYCPLDNYNQTMTFDRYTINTDISSLKPYTRYNISVKGITSAGTGEATTVTAETLTLNPEKVDKFTHTFLTDYPDGVLTNITWQQPCAINGPLNNTMIKISGYFTKEHDNETRTEFSGRNSYLVTKLKHSYKYTISVWLQLQDNEGAEGLYEITTPTGRPGKVTSLNVTQINNTFQIKWQPPLPEFRRGIIQNYTIGVIAKVPAYEVPYYCQNIPKNYTYKEIVVNGSMHNVTYPLETIFHYYYYDVVVTASTSEGLGEPEILRLRTLPSKPDNVQLDEARIYNKITDQYEATAFIKFNQTCFLNGPLINFTLSYRGSNEFEYNSREVNITTKGYNLKLERDVVYEYWITTYTGDSNIVYCNSTPEKRIEAQAGVPWMSIPVNEVPVEKKEGTAKFTFYKRYFDERNGEIRYLALILTKNSTADVQPKRFIKVKHERNEEWPIFSPDDEMNLRAIKMNPFYDGGDKVELVIGDGSGCPISVLQCNQTLKVDTDYYIFVRAYTSSFYRNSGVIHFKTDDLSKLDLILGILFGILFAVLAAFVCFYLWRKNIIKIPNLIMIPTIIAPRKVSDQQPVALRTAYPPKKFISYCKHLENNPDILKQQYLMIKERSADFAMTLKTNFAKLPENRRKNRYTNISPFDETRVKLMIDEDDEIGSDYINASYIRGYTGEVEYIATQGPLESTCRDFWKMILQENVSMIIMVSLFIEQDKVKCHRYFPKNHDSMMVGEDIEIKCSVELHFGIYCVRTLQIRKDNFQTTVTHMQFLEWPDFGVPTGNEHMLQFCYQIRDRIDIEEGIMVVHCSAGVGRTGTLIATDILLQAANAGKSIDVFSTVEELRKQRMNMVQTEEQYIYIHKLLAEHLDRPRTPEYLQNQSPIYENQSIINASGKRNNSDEDEEAESKF